jgi:broad specificity phosphatase PhoE
MNTTMTSMYHYRIIQRPFNLQLNDGHRIFVFFRRFHELIPLPSPTVVNNSINSIHRSGISRIAFLRHGKTGLAPDGIDFNRTLTDEGRNQAIQSGRVFGTDLLPLYPVVILSPSPRTIETANLFLASAFSASTKNGHHLNSIQKKLLNEAYDGTMQPEGSAIFKKLGYAPLIDYIENNDLADRTTARRLLGSYASTMAESFIDILDTSLSPESELQKIENRNLTLLFVGHAIYLPALVFVLAKMLHCDHSTTDIVLNSMTGHAEGYLIDINLRQVRYLSSTE